MMYEKGSYSPWCIVFYDKLSYNIYFEGIKIASYNVRDLGSAIKRREIFHFLNKKDYDVVFLQETHSMKNSEQLWSNEWG